MILLVNVRFSVILGFRLGGDFLHLSLGNDNFTRVLLHIHVVLMAKTLKNRSRRLALDI